MRKTKLLIHNQITLVLNMDWIPLLGDVNKIKQQAKRLQASHTVISGKPASAMGLAYGLKVKSAWSLAELFANHYPKGTYACVFELESDCWHVLASHEGVVVVHADRSYASQAQALSAVDQFLQAYPGLELMTFDNRAELFDLLIDKKSQSALLNKLNYGYLKLTLLLLALGLATIWQFWSTNLINASQANNINATDAWQHAIDRVLADNRIHGIAGTKKLLQSIHAQPLTIAGWVMHSIQCGPSAVVMQWLCYGEYKRKDLNADNKGFMAHAPANWQMEFPSLDLIKSKWAVVLPSNLIQPNLLPKSKIIETNWASELQYMLPAFTTLRLGAAQIIKITAPTTADGMALPKPANLPYLANRKLIVSGPLRSAILLKNIANSIAWQKIFVSYKPGIKANTKASSLTIQLEGHVYESRS